MKKLNVISKINNIGLVIVILFFFWIAIQFPETQSAYTNKRFQQTLEQEQSIEEIKKTAKNFSQAVNYTQGAAKLIGASTILLSFLLIIILATNLFIIRKLKKSLVENNA